MYLAVLGVVGIVVLSIAAAVTATRRSGERVVKWTGFGVAFEIRPCVKCRFKE